jgi:hypothetical protein
MFFSWLLKPWVFLVNALGHRSSSVPGGSLPLAGLEAKMPSWEGAGDSRAIATLPSTNRYCLAHIYGETMVKTISESQAN